MLDFSHLSEKFELLQLPIDGKPIKHVIYFRFLGVLFEENKLLKVIGILNRLNRFTHKIYCYKYIIIFMHPTRIMDCFHGVPTHVNLVSKL